MILGVIKGQELSLSAPVMAGETIAYLTAEFQFSPDWEGLTKYAFFEKRGQKPYKIELVDDKITEDKQLNLEEGIYEVYLIGMELADGKTYQRITTVVSAIEVEKTGFLDGEPFPVEPPSFGEQLLQRITVLETKAIPKGGKKDYVLTKSSDNDFDTEWKPQTGGGGGSGTFDHNELINRDIANQHPISAIGGLTEALANKQPVDDYALRNELPFTVHIERDGKNYSADYSNLQIKEFINSGGSVNANLDGFIYPLWLSGGTIIFSLKEPLISFPQMSDTQIMLTDNKISEGKYKAIVNQHTQRVVKSSDFESLKTEVEAKADKTYVDTLIGNLSTVIDSINGTIGGETV